MDEQSRAGLDARLAEDLRDAILTGTQGEFKTLIDKVSIDGAASPEIRNGLEALYYFRAHYGPMTLSDTNKKKVILMDAAFAMDLINKIKPARSATQKSA